ncbi:MAG: protein-disulfide reductase DsbD [Wenzhouxiangellaceae bacterium]|nr:protein-disulfide reductase DsbD [Wenzhouxiangellaceae bacterium]
MGTFRHRLSCWLTALLLAPAALVAQINPDDLLPVEQAFALSAEPGDEAVVLTWDIAEGYYLYRHAFDFSASTDGLALGEARIPNGKAYSDEFFGDVEVYRGQVRVTLPLSSAPPAGPIEIVTRFQGCADLGVCYPPQRTPVTLAWQPPVERAASPVAEPSRSLGDVLSGLGSSRLTGRGEPLPPEQAFVVEAIATAPNQLLARFTMADGYYLYQPSLDFSSDRAGVTVTAGALPPAEPMHDEFFGDTRVYFNQVEIPLTLTRPAGPATTLPLTVALQGCQTDGICYPPMTRVIEVDLPAATAAASAAVATGSGSTAAPPAPAATVEPPPESDQDRLARLIVEQPLVITLGLFVLLGIGLAFTPCVFPMIPILSGIIAGEGENVTRGKAFALSLAYVLAMALTYTSVGVIAALAGYNLQAMFQNPWVLGTFAAIFVALAMAMFGFYNLQMPASVQARLTEISNRQSGGSLIGAGIMGFLSALIVGPCVTAPLIGILIFISQTGDAVLGGSVLFALSIGMGLPLLAIGIGLGSWLPRAGAWMDAVKAGFGVGLLALAIWMLERVIPGGVTMLLWGALLVGSGVYLGALARLDVDAGGWRKLGQAVGVIALVFGIVQLIGAAAGGRDWLKPLAPFTAAPVAGGMAVAGPPEFVKLADLAALERAVAAANRPMFVDFYADWCVDCKRMERSTFPDPAVARAMGEFDLVKIDMTDFNDDHQQILNAFGLIGPPAYLFFNDGGELADYRMYGFMPPETFTAHLARVRQAAGG